MNCRQDRRASLLGKLWRLEQVALREIRDGHGDDCLIAVPPDWVVRMARLVRELQAAAKPFDTP